MATFDWMIRSFARQASDGTTGTGSAATRVRRAVMTCAALLAACGLVACERSPERTGGGGKPVVVCTTGMVADLARAIGGDRIELRTLMGPGVDPHLYKASPGDVRALESAALVLYSGLHLEGRMIEPIEAMARTKPVVAVAEAVPVERRRKFEGEYASDPHVWMDASLWSLAGGRVRDELIKLDPAGRERITAASATLTAELAELHQWAIKRLGQIPADRRVLVTAHDAFGYFGRAYGVEVLAVQGVSTDSEAGLRDINALIDTLVKRKIGAVFVETSVPPKTIQALVEGCAARGHPIKIGGELYSDALGGPGSGADTYAGMFRHNVETIATALGAGPDAAPLGAPGRDQGTTK